MKSSEVEAMHSSKLYRFILFWFRKIKRMHAKFEGMLLDEPSQEAQHLTPEVYVKIVPQRIGGVTYAALIERSIM
jgi:hypothetical protein